jgi:hypothetical protein
LISPLFAGWLVDLFSFYVDWGIPPPSNIIHHITQVGRKFQQDFCSLTQYFSGFDIFCAAMLLKGSQGLSSKAMAFSSVGETLPGYRKNLVRFAHPPKAENVGIVESWVLV